MIKRNIINKISSNLGKREILILTGARQVGKTTCLRMIQDQLQENGEKTLYLNLDIERDKQFLTSQESLINYINLNFGKQKGYVFLDEIQRKENAGIFLKGIFDMSLPHKFIVSGSASIDLKSTIIESLAGRKKEINMYPVSFEEFCNYRTGYKYEANLHEYLNLDKVKADSLLHEYLSFGGYPSVITADTGEEKLSKMDDIFTSYIQKDISSFIKIEREDAFIFLIRYLASMAGKILNYSDLSLKAGISLNTVKDYLWYAEKTFIIKLLRPYFKNYRKELVKSPVVYFKDTGISNYARGIFGNINNREYNSFGFQNIICNFADEKISGRGWTLNYWRTTDKAEVDFVINKQTDTIPIEVKYANMKRPQVTRSLRNFLQLYKPETAYTVNLSLKDEIKIGRTLISFMPYYEFINKLEESLSPG